MLVARGAEDLAASMNALWAQAATSEAVTARIEELMWAEDRDWVAIEALLEAAHKEWIFIPPDLYGKVEQARAQDHSFADKAGRCAACLTSGRECTLTNVLICRTPVDLSVLGDIRGIGVEGYHMITGEEVDHLELALSAVGLGATVAAAPTAGTSLPLKVGAGTIKMARRIESINPLMLEKFGKIASTAVAWDRVSEIRLKTWKSDLRAIVDMEKLEPLRDTVKSARDLRQATNTPQALYLLKHADNADEVKAFAAISKSQKHRTVPLLDMIGKSKLLKRSMRYSDEVWDVVAGVAGFFAGLIGLMFSFMTDLTMHGLRRAAR